MDNVSLVDDLAVEKSIKDNFGVSLDIDSVIVRNISVGRSANATLFLTKKKLLYCYIGGETKFLLSDIQKVISRIGLKAELYFPPKGQIGYFDEIGRQKFRDVFPGRHDISDQDIAFYRTLSPYSPALVLISEVKAGMIYCADSDSKGGWRPLTKFTYRRIKTS